MNRKILFTFVSVASVVFAALVAVPAFAAALGLRAAANFKVGAGSTTISSTLMASAKADAKTKIDTRVTALNSLETRIGQMQKISASEKATLDTNINTAVGQMTTLESKIEADTDATTLKADIQSITKSYRVYVLILPQGKIIAAGDRAMDIVALMGTFSAKLQTRIASAQASGQNVTTISAAVTDINSKTADANVQAQAAISEVEDLSPDDGSATLFQSNEQALKDARAKIKTATSDLVAARQDIGTIIKALESFKTTASASSTVQTTSGQ